MSERESKIHADRADRLPMNAIDHKHDATMAALDHIAIGVIFVDAAARLITANAAALGVLRAEDGLKHKNGRVHAWALRDRNALEQTISLAAEGGCSRRLLQVARPSGRPPLWALVLRLSDQESGSTERPVALFIGDPDRRYELPNELAALLYGLTPTETKLMAELVNGRRLSEIATSFGVTRNTIRSELRSIFAKTGASRQAHLVKLVISGPCQLYYPMLQMAESRQKRTRKCKADDG